MKIPYFQLFWSFFKIGTFTIGGGYAMIPLMEKELVDRRGWLAKTDFLDILSLSQALPGVFAVNMATNIGYRLRGFRGAVVSVMGNIAVPILIILLLAMGFRYWKENIWVERCFKGIRPAVVALIAAPVFKLSKTAQISWKNAWIPVVSALLIYMWGVSPVWIIVVAIVCGYIYGCLQDRKEVEE